jgi:NTE family protein
VVAPDTQAKELALCLSGGGYCAMLFQVDDVHAIAGRTIDLRAVVRGLLGPGTIGDAVARAYRRRIFRDETLQDLPKHPRFVFCATNLQTGSLWRFSRPYMADYPDEAV